MEIPQKSSRRYSLSCSGGWWFSPSPEAAKTPGKEAPKALYRWLSVSGKGCISLKSWEYCFCMVLAVSVTSSHPKLAFWFFSCEEVGSLCSVGHLAALRVSACKSWWSSLTFSQVAFQGLLSLYLSFSGGFWSFKFHMDSSCWNRCSFDLSIVSDVSGFSMAW
ncbi:hypothetical protein Rs2_52717 [Raphanus sativus]|nr:hypothetical protein Rs2_52717 [Raphanus sativus]